MEPKRHDEDTRDAKQYVFMGAGVAAIGALGAVVGGAICPVCVVASPALIGFGAYKAWKTRRLKAASPR